MEQFGTTSEIDRLIKLVVENKLDFLKVGDVEIHKSKHESIAILPQGKEIKEMSEDEILFMSSDMNSVQNNI